MSRYDWSKWEHLLGELPDSRLAEKVGCDRTAIAYQRHKRDIPAYTKPRPKNVLIECACGCGKELWKYDERGRERQFLPSHWSNVQPTTRRVVHCEYCGSEINRPRWHREKVNHHFCSHDCEGAWSAANGRRSGENNGMWAGGIGTFYPPVFTEELREEIRRRDSYECQVCNVKQSDLDRALDVHHIDYDRYNCDKDNLVALCHSCHAKTSAPNSRSRWQQFFEGKGVMPNDVFRELVENRW